MLHSFQLEKVSSGVYLSDHEFVEKLRIAILVESLAVPAWVVSSVHAVLRLHGVEIVAILLNPVPKQRGGIWARFRRGKPYLIWKGFERLDRMLFRPLPDATAIESVESLLADVPKLQLRPQQSRFFDKFDDVSIAEVSQLKLDVCLSFCHRILRGSILNIAVHGVWSFHHGDGNRYRGGPPAFWEVTERNPVTGSMLQVLSENLDGGKVLARSWSATDPTSPVRTSNQLFWRSSTMMARALRQLVDGKAPAECPPTPEGAIYCRQLYKPPKNTQALRHLLPHISRGIIRRTANAFRREQWQLLYSQGPAIPAEVRTMRRLQPPNDRLWADPMVFQAGNRVYVFIEELIYRRGAAHISVMEYDEASGNFSAPVPVLQRPYHLSYPHVFEAGGQYWMIPETSANRQIELYVAEEFPKRWRLANVLMKNCNAVDATLFYHDDQWWMFAGMAETNGASVCDETFLFRADRFDTDCWHPHPANPIVSDVRRARPAGPILRIGDSIMRPSQDCSVQYGYGLRLNRVESLTHEDYREREAAFITPTWEKALYGVHHISNAGGLTMMDVSVRRFAIPGTSVFRRD